MCQIIFGDLPSRLWFVRSGLPQNQHGRAYRPGLLPAAVVFRSPDGGSDQDWSPAEDFSKSLQTGPLMQPPAPYSYLNLNENSGSHGDGLSFDMSPLSSPENEPGEQIKALRFKNGGKSRQRLISTTFVSLMFQSIYCTMNTSLIITMTDAPGGGATHTVRTALKVKV